MKINFENLKTGVKISTLRVSETFVTNRKSCKEEVDVYMIVDANSGLFNRFETSQKMIAVNLDSGQLRKFNKDTIVDRVEAEVIFKK